MELTLDQALKKGIEAHKAGQVQEADRFYTAILKVQPKHPDANHNMGVLAVGVGKIQEALQFFKTALEANPITAQYWLSYIDILIKLDRLTDAKAVIDKAKGNGVKGGDLDQLEKRIKGVGSTGVISSRNRDPAQDQLQPIINLYSQGHLQQALDKASQLLKEFSTSIVLYGIQGAANAGLGHLAAAVISYKQVLAIEPDSADAYYNMGNIFKEQGELDEAIEACKNALGIRPDFADAYYNMGNAFQQQGKLDEAIEAYKKALTIKPGNADAYNNMGNALKEQGKLEEAIEAYNKTLSFKPDFVDTSYNMALLLYQTGQYKKAASLFRKNTSSKSQTWFLKCLYKLDNQTHFYDQLDYLINQGENNSIIGSYTARSKIRYGVHRENPFCNQPLKYALKIDLAQKCDFKNVFIKGALKILSEGVVQRKTQDLLIKGSQTAGNVFGQIGPYRDRIQDIIRMEIENYRLRFKDRSEGLITNWPANYKLDGWIVKMKNGGAIKPHMHEQGWISGSVYINIPPKLKEDSGNLVVCVESETDKTDQGEHSKSIDVVTGSLCLFPSSLLHYTIPFEADEDRIVMAFDVVPD